MSMDTELSCVCNFRQNDKKQAGSQAGFVSQTLKKGRLVSDRFIKKNREALTIQPFSIFLYC